MDWEPDAITWYMDGVTRKEYTDTATISNKPMYLLADLAVGGSWPRSSDSTSVFPGDFLIDYIRVWKKCTTCAVSSTISPSTFPTIAKATLTPSSTIKPTA